ncbi:MAG TPA: PLP-dependent aminotransferase family protein [Gemmatimonadaceae bacterium]|nr:PLP-dependent aminotransferase family protein [Gemmatimonadaceae bacterium]
MARRRYTGPFAIDLFRPLQRDGAVLLSDQLADRIRQMVAMGQLKSGDYLPPIRLVASKLRINAGTVAKAYENLRRQDAVAPDSTRGLRLRAAGSISTEKSGDRPWAGAVIQPVIPSDPLSVDLPLVTGSPLIRFHVSEPGVDLMPTELVTRAFGVALRHAENLRYAPLAGLDETRAAAEDYLSERGVALAGAEIILTTGTTQSLAIITRALLPAGGVVLTEHPTWHVALSIFAAAGARVIAMPVDSAGMQVAGLADAVLRYNPAFVYLQPSFQNPTGTTLVDGRRRELLAIAGKFQLPIVEDDFGSDLPFGRPCAPLRTPEAGAAVIHLKSFAKLISPALRVGVIVAPSRYVRVLSHAKHGLDPFVSAIAQRALTECLRSGDFHRHLVSMRHALGQRWRALDTALRQHMPTGVRWTTPAGGFCAWLELPSRIRPRDFIQDAAKQGIQLSPGRLFCLDESGDHGLRLSFAAVSPDEINRGIRMLADLLKSRVRPLRSEHAPRAVAP